VPVSSTDQPDYTATLPGKRVGSGLLISDGAGRLLIVEPTYKDHWEIPGGTVERDESPYAAATREATEELGLTISPGRLLVVDWSAPHGRRTEGINFIYAGPTLTSEQAEQIRLPEAELRSWAWCTPAEAEELLRGSLALRVRAALAALAEETTLYLENTARTP
jgi:8-oxo-dGTP diphosphatase